MKKAVLFDLDGTLINSLNDLANSANYALAQCGYPTHETEVYKYFVGDGVYKLMERALPEGSKNKEVIHKLLDIYIPYYHEHSFDETRPYEGISELLYSLKNMDIRAAVVSNKPHEQTEHVISCLFEKDIFSFVAGNKEGFLHKPDPAIVHLVLEALGLSAPDALFVGDTRIDMQTAINAGITAVGVTWGFRTEHELIQNGADYIVHKPYDIINLLADA